MTGTRTSRTQESRQGEETHEGYQDNWESPSLLDTKHIPARNGMVQRWVRTKLKNDDDQNNVFRKINQGWQPRSMDSVPKGQFVPKIDFQGGDVIGIHGMILMERPAEQNEKHSAYNRKVTQDQMKAVTSDMHSVHEDGDGFTRPEMKSHSSVSKGRITKVAPD